MIVTECHTCNEMVFVAETEEEQRNDPRSTKYWSYEEDKSKRPFCDAACALIDYETINNRNIPDWLIASQKINKGKTNEEK